MFVCSEDMTIHVTRGDTLFFKVTARDQEEAYQFQSGDVLRFTVYQRKNAANVLLQKDFYIFAPADHVQVYLTGEETKLGPVISKPQDYWYEVELNPDTDPRTIIGYDADGAKVLRLYPEGIQEVQL